MEKQQEVQILCPRNCYSSCGILASTSDGKVAGITGDKAHPYSKGHLCAKGNSYIQQVYSPDRILYPMRQTKRGSGQWEKISWEEALQTIAVKILELKNRYGSTLPVLFNKFSGNMGIMHKALDGFFNSIGPVTLAGGSVCNSSGADSLLYTFGELPYTDPKDMTNADFIVIWGGNPAWTAPHQMMYLNEARDRGAKIAVVDPLYTATAAFGDTYYQIRSGTDGALALGICRHVIDKGLYNKDFISQHVHGFTEFSKYLTEQIDLDWVSLETGLGLDAIEELAVQYAKSPAASIWMGFGLQRHANSGQTLRAISCLPALTGHIGTMGSSIYYVNYFSNCFSEQILKYPPPVDSGAGMLEVRGHRLFPVHRLGKELLAADPPVRMAFIAGGNPVTQYPDTNHLKQALDNMELVVTVDTLLSNTAKHSDLILPTTSLFEHEDVVYSYWHQWVGYSHKAIPPRGESRSDLDIAISLSAEMNRQQPGSSNFPTSGSDRDFIRRELNQHALDALQLSFPEQIYEPGYFRNRQQEIAWTDYRFPTPSGRIELESTVAGERGFAQLPEYKPPVSPSHAYPYRLLTPHSVTGLNSQFVKIGWLEQNSEPLLQIGIETAERLHLRSGQKVRVYNQFGELELKVQLTPRIPQQVLVFYQGLEFDNTSINSLIPSVSTDMGELQSGFKGVAYYDVFVNIQRMSAV